MFKKLLTKVLLTFLAVYTAFLTILTPVAHAQQWYDQPFRDWFVKVYDPNNTQEIFGERYTAAQVQWVIYGFISWFTSPFHDIMYCFYSGGITDCIITIFGDLIETLFTAAPDQRYYAGRPSTLLGAIFEERPISLITYTKDAARKFHLIPQVEAQAPGFGHQGLQIVQSLWVASRNIVYSLFILVIIILAFMVMFRSKISPQAAITVQSALPRIVIALVLVTFSYAIAGFLIDLMYVVIGIISLLIAESHVFVSSSNAVSVFNWLTKGTISVAGYPLIDTGIFGMIMSYFIIFSVALLFVLFYGGGFIEVIMLVIFAPFTGLAVILTLFVLLAFHFVLCIIAFKIAWMLLKTYATLLILTIVAPFQIVLGAVAPAGAQGMGFGAWVKAYVAQLAVFPTVGLLFTLGFIFATKSIAAVFQNFVGSLPGPVGDFLINRNIFGLFPAGQSSIPTAVAGWPPLMNSLIQNAPVVGPAFAAQVQAFILLGVSLIILMIIPKTAEMIKSIISGRPFGFGTAIGEAFAPLTGAAAGTAGYLMGAGKEYVSERYIKPTAKIRALRAEEKGKPRPVYPGEARRQTGKPPPMPFT